MAYDVRNRMPAGSLVKEQGCKIEFVANPKKAGNIFFTCGKVVGGVSDKVKKALADKTLTIDQVEYAEVSQDGGEYVAVLMMKSTNNVVATLG